MKSLLRGGSRVASGLSLSVALLAAPDARANSRFPESNQISFAKDDPDLVLLRVTFGLLISHDRGKTFRWTCEQSIGFSGVEDPMYIVPRAGSIVASTFQGITMTRDRGCSWSFAEGEVRDKVFIDLAGNPNDPKNLFAFASSYDRQGDGGSLLFASTIYETKDEANTFAPVGPNLDPTLLGYTLDLTKTDPNRIYATAVRNPGNQPVAALLTSKDHGKTWDELSIPLVDTERSIFIAAVDPTNAERVYLRTANNLDRPGRLLVREADPDGGVGSVRTIFTGQGPLLGFALSPDGSKIYVGGTKDGVHGASTTDFAFTQRATIEIQCLTWAEDGLWACSTERSGFIAGISKDDGATFQSVVRFCDIQGPLACNPGTPTADQCNQLWPVQRPLLGCGGLDGGADAGPGPGAAPSDGGCDCQFAPAESWRTFAGLGAGSLLFLRLLLRRRRRREP